MTLPFVDDNELETLIDQRVASLRAQLLQEVAGSEPTVSSAAGGGSHGSPQLGGIGRTGSAAVPTRTPSLRASPTTGGRGTVTVSFLEKRRRKAWMLRGDEEICWETWLIRVTVVEPRTDGERAKVRRAMEQTLFKSVMKIITIVNANKDHIPPITTSETNPFPYRIDVDVSANSSSGSAVARTAKELAAVAGGWGGRLAMMHQYHHH